MLTTEFVNGSPCWIDLGSPEPGAAAAFYAAVFGWQFTSAGPDSGGYGFFQLDGKTVAGLGPLTEEGARSAWTIYFRTSDADASAKAAEQTGATIRTEAFDVMGAGRIANLTGPLGADFAVWQPGEFQGFEVASTTGSLVWAELHVPDPAVATSFYSALFDWRSAASEMPDMPYTILSTGVGDQDAASFGGIAPLQEGENPNWLPYFGAEDVDDRVAAAVAASGVVIVPPMDIPTVGRFAILADPFGATFALLKALPPA